MLTKDGILEFYRMSLSRRYEGHWPTVDVLKAMDEYAKQVAINYDKWKVDNNWQPSTTAPIWKHFDEQNGGYLYKTTSELFELYLKSKE